VSRRSLQIVLGLLGVIPVVTGVLTMMGLADPIYTAAGLPVHALLDSNLRFLGGLWLVLGLAMFWVIPRIERETALFRVLWLMIFVGGVGRLLSMALVGAPPWPFIGFTLLEIVGAPLFIAWQARLANGAAPLVQSA
jgi:FtsH-binding integral membrane protein